VSGSGGGGFFKNAVFRATQRVVSAAPAAPGPVQTRSSGSGGFFRTAAEIADDEQRSSKLFDGAQAKGFARKKLLGD
jgi:hypothetical protein